MLSSYCYTAVQVLQSPDFDEDLEREHACVTAVKKLGSLNEEWGGFT